MNSPDLSTTGIYSFRGSKSMPIMDVSIYFEYYLLLFHLHSCGSVIVDFNRRNTSDDILSINTLWIGTNSMVFRVS